MTFLKASQENIEEKCLSRSRKAGVIRSFRPVIFLPNLPSSFLCVVVASSIFLFPPHNTLYIYPSIYLSLSSLHSIGLVFHSIPFFASFLLLSPPPSLPFLYRSTFPLFPLSISPLCFYFHDFCFPFIQPIAMKSLTYGPSSLSAQTIIFIVGALICLTLNPIDI